MKPWNISLLVVFSLGTSLVAHEEESFESSVTSGPKPWTHLDFQNDPDNFQFAIVTDRTGSPRPGIFEDAVMKLNWLMPEFVMSVGDLIRGGSADEAGIEQEWIEFDEMVEPLKMPFFYLAGNHDIRAKKKNNAATSEEMTRQWNKRLGPTYYYYVYKDVLFLAMFSNDGLEQHIDLDQIEFFKQVLDDHKDVRWTMVFIHHPLWTYPHKTNFEKVEAILEGRKHTVFAGHQHFYRHFERKNTNYYTLATTGGGSPLLGNSFGQFDHVTWVTMTDEGPTLANLRLDGILPHDVSNTDSAVWGSQLVQSSLVESTVFLKGTDPVKSGKAYLTIKNSSEHELHVDGRFFHNHLVNVKPTAISRKLAPNSQSTIEVSLEATHPFAVSDGVFLELDTTFRYEIEKYPELEVSKTIGIKVENSVFNAMQTQEAVFADKQTVTFAQPPPNTVIRYTTDGSKLSSKSALYNGPFTLKKSTTVNAQLFTTEGFKSQVDSATFKKIKPGKGLLSDVYEYDESKGRWNIVPDYDTMTPVTTKVIQELHPLKAAGKEEVFGLVYRGKVKLPKAGEYIFTTVSDDGIILFIDGKAVVTDEVKHPVRISSSEPVWFEKGKHDIEVHYFQHAREYALELHYSLNGSDRKAIPFEWFSFE